MLIGSICITHSPLMDRNRSSSNNEQSWWNAVNHVSELVAQYEPDITLVFHPDHVNGFFYNLLPSFCVGISGYSIGDFGTVPGKLNIPEKIARHCAEKILQEGVDVAISYKMMVDHGASMPIELLSKYYTLTNLIPIFINCALAPRPTFRRVRTLGAAVGKWAKARPERIMLVASGGLSHDPPIPNLETASAEMRERLVNGGEMTYSERLARQNRLFSLGEQYARGGTDLLPINEEFDNNTLESFRCGALDIFDGITDDELTKLAGRGGHEIRCWVAALSALGASYQVTDSVYVPIKEWLTGMSCMVALPTNQ